MVEVPTDPEVCRLHDEVCQMRRDNQICPMCDVLDKIERQLSQLVEQREIKKEFIRDSCEEHCER